LETAWASLFWRLFFFQAYLRSLGGLVVYCPLFSSFCLSVPPGIEKCHFFLPFSIVDVLVLFRLRNPLTLPLRIFYQSARLPRFETFFRRFAGTTPSNLCPLRRHSTDPNLEPAIPGSLADSLPLLLCFDLSCSGEEFVTLPHFVPA